MDIDAQIKQYQDQIEQIEKSIEDLMNQKNMQDLENKYVVLAHMTTSNGSNSYEYYFNTQKYLHDYPADDFGVANTLDTYDIQNIDDVQQSVMYLLWDKEDISKLKTGGFINAMIDAGTIPVNQDTNYQRFKDAFSAVVTDNSDKSNDTNVEG